MKTSTLSSTRVAGLVAAALLCSMPGILQAQDTPPPDTTTPDVEEPAELAGDKAAAKIGAKFTDFAGSEENAAALVTGLHGGTAVTLTITAGDQTVATEFQPATGEMGYGNVALSLALAQESLTKAGIADPTAEQVVAALNGGTVTNADGTATTLAGVLTLRAAGEGWGDIAKTLGVKVGPLMRELHSGKPHPEHPDKPIAEVRSDRFARDAEGAPRPVNAHRPDWAGGPRAVAPRPPHLPHVPRGGRP